MQAAPVHRSILNPLSVDAASVHFNVICVLDTAVAESCPGAAGAAAGVVNVAELE